MRQKVRTFSHSSTISNISISSSLPTLTNTNGNTSSWADSVEVSTKVAVRVRPLTVDAYEAIASPRSSISSDQRSETASPTPPPSPPVNCIEVLDSRQAIKVLPPPPSLSGSYQSINSLMTGTNATQGTPKYFACDHVFDCDTDQRHLYEEAVSPLIEKFIEGFNVTILAYGQTSSGKTYTMGTDISPQIKDQGIISRAVRHVFSSIKSGGPNAQSTNKMVSSIASLRKACYRYPLTKLRSAILKCTTKS